MKRPAPSAIEIEATRTCKGGWSKETLRQWGVPWPPPVGWRKALIERHAAEQLVNATPTNERGHEPPSALYGTRERFVDALHGADIPSLLSPRLSYSIDVETSTAEDRFITQRVGDMAARIADTADQQTRDALIRLGWTPPARPIGPEGPPRDPVREDANQLRVALEKAVRSLRELMSAGPISYGAAREIIMEAQRALHVSYDLRHRLPLAPGDWQYLDDGPFGIGTYWAIWEINRTAEVVMFSNGKWRDLDEHEIVKPLAVIPIPRPKAPE